MFRNHSKNGTVVLLCLAMLLGALMLFGCNSGSDGKDGSPGAAGPEGPPGTTELVVTDESCTVCHSADKIADIAVYHPDPTDKDLTVTVNTIEDTGGGILRVNFTLTGEAGAPVTGVADIGSNRIYLADIVPAGTDASYLVGGAPAPAGTWFTDYLERWAYERSSGPLGTWAEVGGGVYTYTFATAAGSPEALAEAPDFDATHVQRLVMRVGLDGYNNAVGIQDFMLDGTLLDPQRVLAPSDGCQTCHSPQMQNAAHADSYLDTRACNVCHSPLGHYGERMQNDDAYLTVLAHQIHGAIEGARFDWSEVTYPQDIRNCVTCHTGADNMTDAWKSNPTIEACGSCHETVDFTTGENHAGGVQANGTCYVCHPADGDGFGKSVTVAHDTTPTGVNVPEFDVTLTITDPANSSYYVAGEAPQVRVTLKYHDTGDDVPYWLYTTPQDNAGAVGNGLRVASVYVYGPRAKSVPVLATDTITDPTFDSETDTPDQSHDMFVGGSDRLVTTNETGFGYQLLAIPADMEAGTYMVRVRMGDYGRVGSGNYHIESTAFATIQIGTDTVEEKVAGDACTGCHGTGTAPFHDERHSVVFDTDECLACHDQSGNFAIPIANRVHAVHDANTDGDIYVINGGNPASRDWSDVTYPQEISYCVGCHNSGDTTYKTLPYTMPCAGCHVGTPGVLDHTRQNGGPY